jgi:prolyl oligopeptidase
MLRFRLALSVATVLALSPIASHAHPTSVKQSQPKKPVHNSPNKPWSSWGGSFGISEYPATRVEGVRDTLHGVIVADPYRWLENAKSHEVIHWMNSEDSLTRSIVSNLPERAALEKRLSELSYVENISPPLHRGAHYFYRRRRPDQEKEVLYYRDTKDGPEHVLIDPNTWTQKGNWALLDWIPSLDGKSVAYTMSQNVTDQCTLHVIDVATGNSSDIDVIPGARYATPSWTPKGDGFYYTWVPTDPAIPDSAMPGYQEVRFHKMGQDPKKDRVLVPHSGHSGEFPTAAVSSDGRWLLLTVSYGWTKNDVYFLDLNSKDAKGTGPPKFTPLVVGKDALYNIREWKDHFYLHTNDGAARWRVMRVDPKHPDVTDWVQVVPEREDVTIDEFTINGDHLILSDLKDASSRIEIRNLDGTDPHEVALPTIGSARYIMGSEADPETFFQFESFTTPQEIVELSISDATTKIWARAQVPVDPDAYQVEQVFYPSKDGTKIPMFLTYKKGLQKNGTAAALLTGYGGFQVAMKPYFSPRSYSWLERGGILAVACLRGGNEYGEPWHRAGMLLNKQNVFDDFIAASEYLVREKYTTSRRLAIIGGSNGGLLVGAAMTQKPGLFRAVVCQAPLLDMLRYQIFGSGVTWVPEYGSASDPEQFKALYAYSPYHHVRTGVMYPALLMVSPESDDRVDPMHARKFVAAIQRASTGGPALFELEREASHRGADRIHTTVELSADIYSFLWDQVGDGTP